MALIFIGPPYEGNFYHRTRTLLIFYWHIWEVSFRWCKRDIKNAMGLTSPFSKNQSLIFQCHPVYWRVFDAAQRKDEVYKQQRREKSCLARAHAVSNGTLSCSPCQPRAVRVEWPHTAAAQNNRKRPKGEPALKLYFPKVWVPNFQLEFAR